MAVSQKQNRPRKHQEVRPWPGVIIDRIDRGLHGPFDLGWCEADSVSLLQHLIGAGGEPIDADEIIRGLGGRKLLGEELSDGGAVSHFELASESTAIIVDEQNLHER